MDDRTHDVNRQVFQDAFTRLTSGPGARFKGDDFRSMCQPQVYLFLKNKGALYVGMSGSGMERPFQKRHEQAVKARAICDEVLAYPCRTEEDALELEQTLIGCLAPKFNRRGRGIVVRNLTGGRRISRALRMVRQRQQMLAEQAVA